ncbi:MAG: acyl-CoA dehydrogenase family protein [Myxococcota bacterium]|nr:acyl-CoA dehydrogenase family protein [Myxococcota bacterium]
MSAGLDLGFDDAQRAIADAIVQFCAERCPDEVVKASENRFPAELWRELAELGALALLIPEGDGGAVELVAALESLGRAVFPGPLPATFFATQVLGESERRAVAAGERVVSVGTPPLLPWAPVADLFVIVQDGRAARAEASGAVEPVETLGGEPWGRVALEAVEDLGPCDRAQTVYDLALAAYVAGAAARLVGDTAEHARARKQFGRSIGEFQAVAHPLADGHTALAGAATLARAAAFHLDAGEAAPARQRAAAARLSACRAAVEAAHTCHQLFGALGIMLEGPVFHVSRRIRQLASQPPGDGPAREALLVQLGL